MNPNNRPEIPESVYPDFPYPIPLSRKSFDLHVQPVDGNYLGGLQRTKPTHFLEVGLEGNLTRLILRRNLRPFYPET